MDLSKLTREELENQAMKLLTENQELKMKLNWYEEQIRIHQQKHFGASSEKIQTDGQVSLFNEPENDQVMFLPEPKVEDVIVPKKKRYGHKKEITKQFPVETIEYKLSDEERICEKCGNELHEIRSHTEASKGLEFCNRLFKLEEKIKDLTPKEKYIRRNESSKPILDAYFSWVEKTAETALPKSALGLAVNYSLNQKEKLGKYLEDGRLEISNNAGERAIRPFVIGRGNWLFCNTPKGAKTGAMLYSIVETGKENKLNLFNYIAYLLEKLPNIDLEDKQELDKLLPWSSELPSTCRVPNN